MPLGERTCCSSRIGMVSPATDVKPSPWDAGDDRVVDARTHTDGTRARRTEARR